MLPNRLLPALLAGAALLPLACSSGNRSAGGSGVDDSAVLLIDTQSGGDLGLDARVDVLALEAADGTFTTNLAGAGVSLALSRRSGTPAGIRLPAIAPGTYVALRILLAENGVSATDANGRIENVVVASRDLRVPLQVPFTPGSSAAWLLVGHATPPTLTRDGGGRLTWTPALEARPGDAHPLAATGMTVAQVSGSELVGTLDDCGGLRVRGRIDDSTELSDDSGRRDRAGFLADLRASDDLSCDGVLTRDGIYHLRHAHRRSRGESEAKVYGRITELLPAVPAIKVQVQEIVRGSPGLSSSPLPVLTVLTANAHIHRSGLRTERLTFAALAVDQRVEVEWRGAVTDGTVTGHEVEIEDGGSGTGNEIEGQVGSVDLAQSLLVAVPRGNDPLVVGGRSVPSATIAVGAGTVITREVNGSTQVVTLAAAQAGDRIWVIGRVVEPQRVEALVVRLRAAR